MRVAATSGRQSSQKKEKRAGFLVTGHLVQVSSMACGTIQDHATSMAQRLLAIKLHQEGTKKWDGHQNHLATRVGCMTRALLNTTWLRSGAATPRRPHRYPGPGICRSHEGSSMDGRGVSRSHHARVANAVEHGCQDHGNHVSGLSRCATR